jgi:hypothetical protein
MDDTSATIGGLLARMERVERELDELKKGQNQILSILNQAQGGWKLVVYVGSAVAAVIGLAAAFFESFRGH